MEAFLSSTLAVAIAEIGDKTQLLALFLAARFAQKNAIIAGIFVATLLNHFVSAVFGVWVAQWVSPEMMKWIVGISFIAVGLWLLLPDKDDDEDSKWLRYGAFGATLVLFFLAEIGDKTQIATVALAAQFQSVLLVTLGTTFGMLIANIPMIFIGQKLADHLPMLWIQRVAAMLFILFGLVIIVRALL